MIFESTTVSGSIESIWDVLIGTLQTNGYEITAKNPYNQLSAKRGSKLSAAFFEGTKKGFRDLTVGIFTKAQEEENNEFEVQFRFNFPDWAITLPTTKKECVQLVADFSRFVGQGSAPEPEAPGGPASQPVPGGLVCQKCQAPNPPGAAFCGSCGADLTQGAAEPPVESSPEPAPLPADVITCPQCKTTYPVGTNFCARCGTKL